MVRAMSWFTMLGALLGLAAGSFAGLGFVSWYNTPGNTNAVQAAMCPCAENARDASMQLIGTQAGFAIAGVIILNIIGHSIRGRLVRRAAARNVTTTTPAP